MAADGSIVINVDLNDDEFQKSMKNMPTTANQGLHKTLAVYDLFKTGVMKIWGMITSSVESAMRRLDTMDQFSRVMTTMLRSTEKANKALDATTKIVTGAAFGLDTAAKGIQAFVASGMEVSKATDTMGAWADAVAFYTKGTNEELGTVSTALQKMQTKGTVTMEHLQMLLEAGIPAVEIYADAVGISTEEVTEQMSKGQLKTDDFITAMNNAFNSGTQNFPKIAGEAKKAGASWQGSMDNMKAAVTRGVGECLTAFDKMFNIKENMVKFGKTIEQALKWISQNLTFIVPTATAAGAALLVLKNRAAIAEVFNKAKDSISYAKVALEEMANSADTVQNAYDELSRGASFALEEMADGAQEALEGMADMAESGEAATQSLADVARNSVTADEAMSGLTLGEKALTVAMALGNVIKAAVLTLLKKIKGETWANAASDAGLTTANSMLSASFGVLGTAIKAALGPIALFALAVAGIVALVSAIINAVQQANKEYYAEKDALKELKEEHEGYADALKESKKAVEEENLKLTAQTYATKDALNSLAELINENNEFSGSAEDAKERVNDLNSKIEGLGLAYDETTGKINMSSEELKQYGDNLVKINAAQSSQNLYNNLLGEQYDLQAKIDALEAKKEHYQEMRDKGIISQFQYNQLMNEANDLSDEYAESMKDLTKEVDAARDAAEKASASEAVIANRRQDIINKEANQVKQLAKKYGVAYDQILDEASKLEGGLEEWTADMEANFTKSGMDVEMLADKWGMTVDEVKAYCDEWGMTYDEFNEHMKETHTEAGEDIEQLAEKWGVSVEDIQKWIAQNESDLQSWADMMESDMQAWENSVTDHTDSVINDWEKLPDKYDKSLDEMIEIAQENAAKYAEWSDKMAYLSQHMSAESIGYLQELGPAGLSVIDELIDGGVPKMQEFDNAVSGTARDAAVNAANNFSTISPAMIETFNELNSASGLYMNEFGDILNKHSGEAIASAAQILSGDELPESIGIALDNTKAVLEQKGAENTEAASRTAQETANASVDGYVSTTAERSSDVGRILRTFKIKMNVEVTDNGKDDF